MDRDDSQMIKNLFLMHNRQLPRSLPFRAQKLFPSVFWHTLTILITLVREQKQWRGLDAFKHQNYMAQFRISLALAGFEYEQGYGILGDSLRVFSHIIKGTTACNVQCAWCEDRKPAKLVCSVIKSQTKNQHVTKELMMTQVSQNENLKWWYITGNPLFSPCVFFFILFTALATNCFITL